MSVTESKRPLSIDKHIGLEIELLSPYDRAECIKILNKSPLADNIQIKGDSSIEPDDHAYYCESCMHECENHDVNLKTQMVSCHNCNRHICKLSDNHEATNPHELNILFKEKDLVKTIANLNTLLSKIKAHTNISCGMHVHLDMRRRDPYKSLERLIASQDKLFKLVKKDRRDNSFCKKTPKNTSLNSQNFDRHSAINPAAFRKYQTIEVRLHHGTTNTKEIFWWIKNLISIVDDKKTGVMLSKYIQNQIKAMKNAA